MFQVNNKDTGMTQTYLTCCSSVSIINFDRTIAVYI